MVTYLVMKNNVARAFQTKTMYLLIVIIPAVICAISGIAFRLSSNEVRVGVLGEEAVRRVYEERLDKWGCISYEPADASSVHTDMITQKYHRVLDTRSSAVEEQMREIAIIADRANEGHKNSLSKEQQSHALLMISYIVIATIYASKLIKDRKEGTYERFLSTGFSKVSYQWGYMLSTFILVFSQLVIANVLLTVIESGVSSSFGQISSSMFLIALISSTIGVILAMICNSDLGANLTASSLAVLFGLLGGVAVPITSMPEVFQVIAIFNPVHWIILLLQ